MTLYMVLQDYFDKSYIIIFQGPRFLEFFIRHLRPKYFYHSMDTITDGIIPECL